MLLERLVRGDYKFGARISAKEIAEETGASRFMVNSALNELRGEGFLEITAQVGCNVIEPTRQECIDFFVMLGRLEGALAEFAAERHGPEHMARMRAANQTVRNVDSSQPEAGEDYRVANLDFHRSVHMAARSAALARRQETYWMMADFYVTQAVNFREHTSDSALEHDEVIEAIASRNVLQAREVMEEHIKRLGSYVVSHIYDLADSDVVLETI